MNTMRSLVVTAAMVLLSAPLIHGQDLSKYRNFSLGTSLADVSKSIDKSPAGAITVHEHPALIQQLTWWPPLIFDSSLRGENVQQIRFSFLDDKLYRIAVTYDNAFTRGLTVDDIVQSMTAKYGTATELTGKTGDTAETADSYGAIEKVLARWEDPQYSLKLSQSSLSNSFILVIVAKQMDSRAENASAEAVKLEKQEAPDKELARAKKQSDDLETERQKNVKAFRP
jgi:hypothetical protein